MPMKKSTKLVKVLLTNIMIAVAISLTASYIAMSGENIPAEVFPMALVASTLKNSVIAYIISFFIGMFIILEVALIGKDQGPMMIMLARDLLNLLPMRMTRCRA